MTAELADCFSTKSEGVRFIIQVVEAAANNTFATSSTRSKSSSPTILIWSTDGHFILPSQASDSVLKFAAANWHALATWVGPSAPTGNNILIDIGTTTTDIIPLVDGRPVPAGLTDLARLQSGELTYSGVWRTPLCAIAYSVPFRDGYCQLAAELFATTLDIYLLLDQDPRRRALPRNGERQTRHQSRSTRPRRTHALLRFSRSVI